MCTAAYRAMGAGGHDRCSCRGNRGNSGGHYTHCNGTVGDMSEDRAPYIPMLTTDPQHCLCQRYAAARRVWQDNLNVREFAATIGMSEREYCDGYLRLYPPLTWIATTTTVGPTLDYERAFREATP